VINNNIQAQKSKKDIHIYWGLQKSKQMFLRLGTYVSENAEQLFLKY
jgi:hypothetical protein